MGYYHYLYFLAILRPKANLWRRPLFGWVAQCDHQIIEDCIASIATAPIETVIQFANYGFDNNRRIC